VEIDEDSPAVSPMGLIPISDVLLKPDPATDLRLSSSAARKIMFDQVSVSKTFLYLRIR
jgi:hypothetical protein